jgi:hypothetical protein
MQMKIQKVKIFHKDVAIFTKNGYICDINDIHHAKGKSWKTI